MTPKSRQTRPSQNLRARLDIQINLDVAARLNRYLEMTPESQKKVRNRWVADYNSGKITGDELDTRLAKLNELERKLTKQEVVELGLKLALDQLKCE